MSLAFDDHQFEMEFDCYGTAKRAASASAQARGEKFSFAMVSGYGEW